MEFAANATMGARLLGNKDFEVGIAKDIVRREVEALVTACATVGLISVSPEGLPTLVGMAADKACEALSL